MQGLAVLWLGPAVFALALASILVTRSAGQVSALWPVNAVVLVALLGRPVRAWPALFAVSLAGNIAADVIAGQGTWLSVELSLCSTLEILICAGGFRRIVGDKIDLSRRRDLVTFVGLCGVAGPMASALGGASFLALMVNAPFLPAMLSWFKANALGLLILTPALLTLSPAALADLVAPRKLVRSLGLGLMLASCVALVFGQTRYPALFLLLPALLVITFQLELAGAALGLIVTAASTTLFTVLGTGPAALLPGSLADKLGALQVFLLITTVSILAVAAVLADRRRLEATLRGSLAEMVAAQSTAAEAHRRSALATAVAGVAHWRRDIRTGETSWSSEMYRIHGISEAEVDPNTTGYLARFHPDELPILLDRARRTIETGEPFDLKARMTRISDGEERIVSLRGERELDADGAPAAMFGVLRDITDEETALQRVAESEAKYRLLAENATDLIIRYSADGKFTYLSPSIRTLLGYEPHELLGRRASEFIHPEDRAMARSGWLAMEGADPAGPVTLLQHRLVRKDGTAVWVECNPSPVRDAEGRIVEYLDTVRDIGLRKLAADALVESEARYRLLAQHSTDIIACYNPEGIFTFMSPAVKGVLGCAPEDMVGTRTTDNMHPDDVRRVLRLFSAYASAGPDAEPIRFEYRARHRDGSWVWLEAHPKAIYDPDTGALVEFQDTVRDVSVRKTLEAELSQALETAEVASAVKAEFLSNMSHELRTPLTSIIGFSDLLRGMGDLPPEARRYTQRIGAASAGLLTLVNDVLDFSKLEAGQVVLAPRAFSPLALARETLELFEPQAAAKGVALTLGAIDNAPDAVLADPGRLRQILLNLVGNAVKFTDAGEVKLSLAHDGARLRFEISDTGPGIPADRLDRLFQRFSQVDGSVTRTHGGTGLGLAICRGLVEAMGGDIGVESVEGRGSTFAFDIAAPGVGELAEAQSGAELTSIDGVRVLLVDDNPVNRELARAILESQGAEVSDAEDGQAAVDQAAALPFDVILMDMRMPVMDGLTATARIRRELGPNQNVPILAFSADGDMGRLNGLGEQGFNGVVRKPIAPMELIAAVAEAVRWDGADLEDQDVQSA